MNKSEYYEKLDKERQERQEKIDKEREKKKRSDFVLGRDGNGSIFALIFVILFIVLFVRTLLGSEFGVTLNGFLQMLSNVPDVSLSWLTSIDLSIVGDWGAIDGLRLFINSIGDILEILLMLAGGIIQLFMYLLHFINYIFML